jgi:hypothetical protein
VARLQAELDKLREDRQKEKEQQYENRIKELENKLSGGSEVDHLRAQIEELKKQLSGAGQASSMIIYDEKGNPMQVPYDRGFMEALKRRQDVETEAARTESLIKMLALNGGSSDKYDAMIAELKADRLEANKRIEDLTKQITDQRIQHLEERVRSAEEMAASGGGDGKGILEVAQSAGADMKDGIMAAARGIQDNLDKGLDTIKEVITARPAAAASPPARTPQQIAGIMQGENDLLNALGERPNA